MMDEDEVSTYSELIWTCCWSRFERRADSVVLSWQDYEFEYEGSDNEEEGVDVENEYYTAKCE